MSEVVGGMVVKTEIVDSSSLTTASCPLLGSPRQRRPTVFVTLRVDLDLARAEQQLDDGFVPSPGSIRQRRPIKPLFILFESTSTLPVPSSSLTTASCPPQAAYDSGVRPFSVILRVDLDFARAEQQLDDGFVPSPGSPRQRRPTVVTLQVDLEVDTLKNHIN